MLTPGRTPQRKTAPPRDILPPFVHALDTILSRVAQITCLYDMDIPRPDNFNECYLYEGTVSCRGVGA